MRFDAREIDGARAPEADLLERAAHLSVVRIIVVVDHLLDLPRPVDHHPLELLHEVLVLGGRQDVVLADGRKVARQVQHRLARGLVGRLKGGRGGAGRGGAGLGRRRERGAAACILVVVCPSPR